MNNTIVNKGWMFLLLFLLSNVISSCSDTLDEVVYSELTSDNAFKTKDDAVAAVNSIYQPLQKVTARAIFYLNDMTTDDCYMKEMDCELLNESKLSSFQFVAYSWDGYYSIVSRANAALANIPTIADEKFDEDNLDKGKALKARLLAEAYFMRGFAYYELSDLFYKVPLVVSNDVAVDAMLPPASLEEIEQQIESDLLQAKSVLPKSFSGKSDAGRATMGAALGFLCRLEMRMAGRARLSGGNDSEHWQKALEYANELLALRGSVYELQAHVWDIFNPETDETLYNNELIFAVRSSQDIPTGSCDIGMNFTPWEYDMGWNLFSLPLELVWKFDKKDERFTELVVTQYRNVYDNDQTPLPRYYVIPESVEKAGAVYKEEANKITNELGAGYTKKYKYLRPGSYNYNTKNNMPLLRLADIILCKAEILNELKGPNKESIDLINEIRERAFQDTEHNLSISSFTDKDALRNAICDERLFELNNEGVRRPDLIRMGLWKDRIDQYIAGIKLKSEWKEKNATSSNVDYSSEWKVYPNDLTENDIRRYFPAPKRELDLNPALNDCRNFEK